MLAVGVLAAAATVTVIQSASASTPATASDFVPITPCRLFDTRPGDLTVGPRATALGAGDVFTVDVWGATGDCTIPTSATAVSLNVVAIEPTANSFLTVWPAGAARPTASNLNWSAGQAPTPNAVTTALSTTGRMSVFNLSGTVHLAADVVGYFQATTGGDPGAQGPPGAAGAQGPPGPAGTSPLDPANVVWVAPSGGDFTDISDALASITDNDASNPYLVRIAPGTYVENAGIDMKDFVQVEGSGPATVIESSGTGAHGAAVRIAGALHTELRDLAIESTGNSGVRVSGTTDSGDVRLSALDVAVSDGSVQFAVLLDAGGHATITDIDARATGATIQNSAIYALDGSSATIRRSTAHASASGPDAECYGVGAAASTVHIVDVHAETLACPASTAAVLATFGAVLRADRIEAVVSKPTGAVSIGRVISVDDSTATIDRSIARGTAGLVIGLSTSSSTVIVRDSSVLSSGIDSSIDRWSGTVAAIDVIVGGVTTGMAGLCTDVVTQQLDPYTCV